MRKRILASIICASLTFGTVFVNAVSISFDDIDNETLELQETNETSITFEELEHEEIILEENNINDEQNILGNVLECEECGAAYRRRTERGTVVYRCATRMEKGRGTCEGSPTIEEEWIKTEIGKKVCGGEYDEEVVRKKVDRVLVGRDGELKILFFKGSGYFRQE